LNVQTDRIDNHKAQFTIEIEVEQLDEAKRKAAKKIARQVRIKGFRKGKAPYRVIAKYVGEAAILEEAIELLGNDIYKYALDESEVEPYGPGSLDDFKLEPAPTFIFSVPLQPEVDLKGYADVRVDFEAPEVSDEDVDKALEQMRQQAAEVSEEEFEVVEAGHRVTFDLHSEFSDGEEPEDEDEEDENSDETVDSDTSEEETDEDEAVDSDTSDDADDEDDIPFVPKKGDNFLHRHDVTVILGVDEDPVMPGFAEGLVGAEIEEEVQFELTIPMDHDDFKDIGGRKVNFHVTVTKIEAVTLPDLDDEFARKITEEEGDDPLDLDGLRQRTREELEKEAMQNTKSEYGDKVLEKIVEEADIAFPELMTEERIEDMLRDLDNNLQQQGMNLDSYMRITGATKESLQEQYADNAIESVGRTLVLRELVTAQNLEIGDEQIEKHLDSMMILFGGQGDQFRGLIDTPQMRENILNQILMDYIMTQLVAIGQGEDPDKAIAEREAETEAENEKARQRIERMMELQKVAAELEEGEETSEGETIDEAVPEESQDDDSPANTPDSVVEENTGDDSSDSDESIEDSDTAEDAVEQDDE
jgi:trigger factor